MNSDITVNIFNNSYEQQSSSQHSSLSSALATELATHFPTNPSITLITQKDAFPADPITMMVRYTSTDHNILERE
jgi:hypothetical protein